MWTPNVYTMLSFGTIEKRFGPFVYPLFRGFSKFPGPLVEILISAGCYDDRYEKFKIMFRDLPGFGIAQMSDALIHH